MKMLILGAQGIIGSALMRAFPNAMGTTHRTKTLEFGERTFLQIDITRPGSLRNAFDWAKPDVVINCVGIVKSECSKYSNYEVRLVNSIAPHTIAEQATSAKCRVIHLSTDCVFDGTRGNRVETDVPDAADLYGCSKVEGELVGRDHCVTLRTSFIGRDKSNKRGLLEWVLSQTNEMVGFSRMMWSGLSTHALARVIGKVAEDTTLTGLYHVAGPVISKADLLETLIDAYALPSRVHRMDEPKIDRTLDGSKFNQATGYTAPDWRAMAYELAAVDSRETITRPEE